MALNKLMHPRNPYKNKKPDFKQLSIKYEQFRKNAVTDLAGNVHLDFKNPRCLKALTWALLKEDFDLDVVLPEDRLIPTVPLRLNYILWLEDIILKKEGVTGIDIGTGAACVYPLISARKNNWTFLATEADEMNFNYATNNVRMNKLAEQIKVLKVGPREILQEALKGTPDSYDFCMCNPPFFGNQLEAWGLAETRSDARPVPASVSTACEAESIYPGGEVQFVKQMIADSLQFTNRVRVYSSMLGKKSSLYLIKEELKKHKIQNFGSTEFCQGRTMRWGIAWTFDPSVEFPQARSKATKPKPPLIYTFPHTEDKEYNVTACFSTLELILKELEINYKVQKKFNRYACVTAIVRTNTWSNQRKRRRQQKRQEELKKLKSSEDEGVKEGQGENIHSTDVDTDMDKADVSKANSNQNEEKTELQSVVDSDSNVVENVQEQNKVQLGPTSNEKESQNCVSKDSEAQDKGNLASGSVAENGPSCAESEHFLFKCKLELVTDASKVDLKMHWIEGENKEHMHQVLQYIKNKLTLNPRQ